VANQQPSERVAKERVRADDKRETFEIGIRDRIIVNVAARMNCDERIEACREILRRDPGSRSALEPTITIWIRIRDYHIRTIEGCRQALRDLGLPEEPPIIQPSDRGS
jgi:hypothetical protein